MLQSFRNRSDYPFWFEVAPLLLTTAILMVQFFIFKDYTPHVPLIIGICITGLFMSLKGRKWIDMEHNMYRVMKVALPTMVIIMCVGMVIASWIAAGTVPTSLDFGLGMLGVLGLEGQDAATCSQRLRCPCHRFPPPDPIDGAGSGNSPTGHARHAAQPRTPEIFL